MISYPTVYCIKDLERSGCKFYKGKIYKSSYLTEFYNLEFNPYYSINHITILDNNNNSFNYDEGSPFDVNDIPKYFIDIKGLRKQKLDKINDSRRNYKKI